LLVVNGYSGWFMDANRPFRDLAEEARILSQVVYGREHLNRRLAAFADALLVAADLEEAGKELQHDYEGFASEVKFRLESPVQDYRATDSYYWAKMIYERKRDALVKWLEVLARLDGEK
jgi:hypothetical protein